MRSTSHSVRPRGRRAGLVTAAVTALLAMVMTALLNLTGGVALAATLFSDNFNSGSATGWSKSGGDWSVVTDGTGTFQQSKADSELARQFAGSASWTNYTVTARVKPTGFSGSGRYAALGARSTGSSTRYQLALLNTGRAELQAVNGSTVTVIGGTNLAVTTGTWYTLQLSASGSTLTGWVNGAQVASGSSSQFGAGRIVLVTSYASARFDDVVVSDGAAPSPSAPASPSASPSAPTSPSASPSAPASPSPSTSPPPSSGTVYVAPGGTDGAAGTIGNPTTLTSALTRVTAGGTIYMRGGTYNYAQTVTVATGNNGTSSARKKLSAYPGETPVLNFSAQAEDPANRGLAVNGNYWHVYGLVVERAGDNGIFVGGSNNIFERTVTRYNRDTGLQLSRTLSTTPKADWPANNLILSAESHDNADSDGEDADGFAAKLTVGSGNVFRYCVSHNNIDDGWDLYTKTDTGAIGAVTIEDSLAYNNGTLSNGGQAGNGDRNGFKLGGEDIGVNHIVRRTISFANGKHGFTFNRNPGSMTISNNLAINNTERNFTFEAGSSVFRNNTSCRSSSGTNDKIVGNTDSSNQWWMGSNGSRCASYTGSLGWSFASGGNLVVTLGGRVVSL
ncbi:family 16 glycoside hydrolase [Catellatospora methionotrophica]|uniref:family 16 glycoside hydrolase n=1 Tax=Catellatospora methionotrophica TaxID=121620 RepID=UPI0033C5D080